MRVYGTVVNHNKRKEDKTVNLPTFYHKTKLNIKKTNFHSKSWRSIRRIDKPETKTFNDRRN